jgi:hypothetical protein
VSDRGAPHGLAQLPYTATFSVVKCGSPKIGPKARLVADHGASAELALQAVTLSVSRRLSFARKADPDCQGRVA